MSNLIDNVMAVVALIVLIFLIIGINIFVGWPLAVTVWNYWF